MSDRPAPAHGGVVPWQVAEIIVALDGEAGRRGSGYRVGPTAVLTAAHVLDGAVSVRVRFDADRPGEWITEVISCWSDPRSDLAVLTIAPHQDEPTATVARFGRISDRAAVLAVQAVGFPRFKLKTDDGGRSVYRDSHQADGSVAVLSNRREGTLEVTVPPPERDPDPATSPWEGMSGAAVWVGDRIVGVIAKHHRSDGLGRLAAARLDLALERLDARRRADLRALIGLPDVLPDVVPPSGGERVTTAYLAQVRDIAPDQLLDRENELDELVGFCAGDQPYAWWQAGPWAGKSALMAWFVLHPPAGVDVVSFFVTARLAGQSDSDACTDALIEQLAALVGESPAGLLTAGARRGTLLRLLEDAANRSREAGRRLLLVIDGLDEDSGTGTSIAALLPRRPPPEVRVLVASRPHPPVPDDVADDHPLRTISPRRLDVSEHARGVERRAKHELTQLLAGEQLQHDVLGLITAAGGGLTLGDLEELTQQPQYEIRHLLGGLFGRSVGSRTHPPSAGYPDKQVYLFTHETLRLVAQDQFGNSLVGYRGQLHVWADTYRQRSWPTGTPHYLLRGYTRMLASSGELTRFVACAIDQVRHDRMRDLSGGDALAFNEISTAQQLILAQPDPDLTSLALLAVQRDHLTDRNSNVPANLPAVWAMLGKPARAEALANGIPDLDKRARALARLVPVLASSGDHDRAVALTAQIINPDQRAEALFGLVAVVAGSGDHDRAEALANGIPDLDKRAGALAGLVAVVATSGDHHRAARLATDAEALTAQITDSHLRAMTLSNIVPFLARGGDHDRAEALTAQITELELRVRALAGLAEVVATSGNHHHATRLATYAETLITQITYPAERARALVQVAQVVASGGDHHRAARLFTEAEALIMQDTSFPPRQARDLAWMAEVMATGGDHDRAARLATETEALTTQITDSDQRANALIQVAEVVATGRDHDRAARLATQAEALAPQEYIHTLWEIYGLARLVKVLAINGNHDRAETFTRKITDPYLRALALVQLAEVVAISGDYHRATRLATEAEALSAQITDPLGRSVVLPKLV